MLGDPAQVIRDALTLPRQELVESADAHLARILGVPLMPAERTGARELTVIDRPAPRDQLARLGDSYGDPPIKLGRAPDLKEPELLKNVRRLGHLPKP